MTVEEMDKISAEAARLLNHLPYAEAKKVMLNAFSDQFISSALDRMNGNVSHAAQELGVHRRTVHRFKERLIAYKRRKR